MYLPVFAQPIPEPAFIYNPLNPTTLNPKIKFLDETPSPDIWSWYLDGTLFSNDQHPFYEFEQEGEYIATLVVENQYGCIDSVKRTVVVEPFYNIFIPNSFTPDNGDIFNDEFSVVTNGIQKEDFLFQVFDRWGKEVYVSDNRDFSWDGETDSGVAVKQDAYVYKLTAYDVFNNKHDLSGKLLIIR